MGCDIEKKTNRCNTEPGVNGDCLLSRNEAMFILGNSDSVGEGVIRISKMYAAGNHEGLVITFALSREHTGFTHIMVVEGVLRLTYSDVGEDGVPIYNMESLELLESDRFPFSADDYQLLRGLVRGQEPAEEMY